MSDQNYRNTDPPTSKAAGESIDKEGMCVQLLLAYLDDYEGEDRGLTDEQAAKRSGLDRTPCPWRRCSDLRKDKFILPFTDRDGVLVERYSRTTGRKRMVCKITGLGKAYAKSVLTQREQESRV